jgi:hypothetical protein
MVIIHCSRMLMVGVQQVREELTGDMSRRMFSLHLEKQRHGSVACLASPAQLVVLKQYAGYTLHSSQAAVAPLILVHKGMASLGCMPACMEASFMEVLGRHGHRFLLPLPAVQAAAEEAVAAPPAVAAAAVAAAMAAAELANNEPRVSAPLPPPRRRRAAAAAGHVLILHHPPTLPFPT